jgi:hypothetical protein
MRDALRLQGQQDQVSANKVACVGSAKNEAGGRGYARPSGHPADRTSKVRVLKDPTMAE